MRILGIETSCDETAAAVVDDGIYVRSNIIGTMMEDFADCGGVIPEQAARRQLTLILPVIHRAMEEASCNWSAIDAIAVTKGPGLLGSLLVGTMTARVLTSVQGKPLIGVHHTLGHLSSPWLQMNIEDPASPIMFPIITLSASGGHTELWHRTSHTRGTLLGTTKDDAAGEAFDKGATLLGLPYPGGPQIARMATEGNPHAYPFPLPLKRDDGYDFSFSGLKTALRTAIGKRIISTKETQDLCASYQEALCAHLVDRLRKAVDAKGVVKEVHIVGGVSRNDRLRGMVQEQMNMRPLPPIIRWPQRPSFCTDNAAMIASAGYFRWLEEGSVAFAPFETAASLPLVHSVPCNSL